MLMYFTKEELELMRQMEISVPTPTVYKLVKGMTQCKLCKISTTQFIRMAKHGDDTWVKESEVDSRGITILDTPETSGKVETFITSISTCWACKETLLKKEKAELVQMLIDLNSFAQPKETRKKYLISKKEKKGEEDEKES
jgi:hypothetical protein